uniref:Uncharacterized protein n=1 Tax=Vibrio splendidus TaxID=29497 RepID=A0A0H3ZRI3_VIBSP|nr:hypothetical protein [Vibrio splendidus]
MGALSLTHSAGQPERVREISQSESDHRDTQITHKIESKRVGVGAAERAVFSVLVFLFLLEFLSESNKFC